MKQGNYLIISTNYWSWGGLPAAQHFADTLVSRLIESNNTDSASADTSQ
ncbi:hypothetical protein HZZ02_19095 [Streptococcus danieliae]|nr:hypothetical protein [Streptococcus danieliae]